MNLSWRTRESWAKNPEMLTGNRVQGTTKRAQAISLLLPSVRQIFAPIVYGSFPIQVSCFSLHVKRYKHGTSFMSIKQVLKPTEPDNWILCCMCNAQLCIFQWWKLQEKYMYVYNVFQSIGQIKYWFCESGKINNARTRKTCIANLA